MITDNLQYVATLGTDTQLCFDTVSQKPVICKTVAREAAAYYRTLMSIDHPNLAKIHSVNESDDCAMVVREYISGDSIADVLKQKGIIPSPMAAEIIADLCNGLTAMHRMGLVHRDINPNNIILTDGGKVKIIDFGITRIYQGNKQKDTVILGTPGYAAPEQFGFAESDSRVDIYALGVLLNVMLTGAMPGEKHPNGRMKKIVAKCTAMDADKRFQSASQLRRALTPRNDTEEDNRSFFDNIPGFRTNRPLPLIGAIVGYILLIWITINEFTGMSFQFPLMIREIIGWLLIVVVPYCIFINAGGLWERLPLARGMSRQSKKLIYIFIGIIIMVIGITISGLADAELSQKSVDIVTPK